MKNIFILLSVSSTSGSFKTNNASNTKFSSSGVPGADGNHGRVNIDMSRQVLVDNENRPKNMALNIFIKINECE